MTALGFGVLVYLILPGGVTVLNDDFGYLRSVVETIRHDRPWTNDWLEPWAASLSVLSALIYKASGSFLFATHGLQALLAAISFWATFSLFKARGHSSGLATVLAALLLTFPTVLWKSVEFTSVALYLPCLLLALKAAEEKTWGRFCLWWSLAIAARQSAVAWAVFPALEIIPLSRTSTSEPRRPRAPSLSLMFGLGLFGVLTWTMNKTHAQTVVTDQVWHRLDGVAALRAAGVGVMVYLWAAGLNGLLSWRVTQSGGRKFVRFFPAITVLGLFAVRQWGWLNSEHGLFTLYGGEVYCGIAILLGSVGWLLGGFRLRPATAIAAGGSAIVLGLRQGIWDYYLLDVALLGFFGTVATTEASREKPRSNKQPIRAWGLGLLTAFHLLFLLNLKCALDRTYALCSLAETALRQERLRPTELSFAPFGFVGWQMHRYFITHEGAANPALDGFYGYLIPGAVEIGHGYSQPLHIFPRFRHTPPSDRHNLILSDRYRFVWFFQAEYFLLRFKTESDAPPPLQLHMDEYHRERFPLNDAEWRDLIDRD